MCKNDSVKINKLNLWVNECISDLLPRKFYYYYFLYGRRWRKICLRALSASEWHIRLMGELTISRIALSSIECFKKVVGAMSFEALFVLIDSMWKKNLLLNMTFKMIRFQEKCSHSVHQGRSMPPKSCLKINNVFINRRRFEYR